MIIILIGMTAEQPKGKTYWMDEIDFLEARLNGDQGDIDSDDRNCLLYTSPSPRDATLSRMPSSA